MFAFAVSIMLKHKALDVAPFAVSQNKKFRRCPLNNITLQNGKPVWGQDCTHCMACICYCPTEAIEYSKKSLGKPRYHFEAL